ncbi:MAG: vWA domain-containing protein [Planctomycetota bacterium]
MSRTRTNTREDDDEGIFNDVLFCTIGVVLLLLVVALVQVGVPEVAKGELEAMNGELEAMKSHLVVEHRALIAAQDAAEQAQRHSAELTRSLDDERVAREGQLQANATLSRLLDAQGRESKRQQQAAKDAKIIQRDLEFRDTDVVLCLDGTASMKARLETLQTGVLALSEISARLVKIRVGVVIYSGRGVLEFPLTEIGPTVDGKPSEGMKKLREFMELHAIAVEGHAYVEAGVNAALAMFGARRNGTRQHLVVMGDMDPLEAHGDDTAGGDASALRVIASVQEFAQRYEDTGVLSLFTANGRHTRDTNQRIARFFEALASRGKRSKYTNDLSQLTATTVAALFTQQRRTQ